jgi:DNA-binding MarR family transcriptional regulator
MKDDRLIFLLYKAQHSLSSYLSSQLTKSVVKISAPQSGILFLLRDSNMQTMSELGRKLSIDNSAITGLVDRLERDGFVAREMDSEDRRKYFIRLTGDGLKEVKKAESVIKKVNEEIKKSFSVSDIDSFKAVLNSFFDKFHSG